MPHARTQREGAPRPLQILKFTQDLGLPNVKATPTGCLGGSDVSAPVYWQGRQTARRAGPIVHHLPAGNCGKGPNVALLPQEQVLNHVSTLQAAVQVLSTFCDAGTTWGGGGGAGGRAEVSAQGISLQAMVHHCLAHVFSSLRHEIGISLHVSCAHMQPLQVSTKRCSQQLRCVCELTVPLAARAWKMWHPL